MIALAVRDSNSCRRREREPATRLVKCGSYLNGSARKRPLGKPMCAYRSRNEINVLAVANFGGMVVARDGIEPTRPAFFRSAYLNRCH